MPQGKNAGSHAGPKRRIMRALKINEISGVDVPAQEGAVAVIMKRAEPRDPQTEISKKAWLTTSVDGHAHLVDEQDYEGKLRNAGDTSWTRSEGDDSGHSHPWVRNRDGSVTIGEAEGHSHEVIETEKRSAGATGNVETKEKDDQTMPKDNTQDQPTVEALQAQLKTANALAALTDVEKAHYNSLEGDEAKATFLGKSADDRKADVDKAAEAKAAAAAKAAGADPVVYTTMDGVELRKSAGEALIAMAKSNDAIRKENQELREGRESDALNKRAEVELAHLPGTVEERAALLKAAEGIKDEGQRKAALNALKAQNEAMSYAFKSSGTSITPAPGSPADDLDNLAKKHREANPDLTPEQAYSAVLKTAEGRQLYAKSVN
jgi:hypothetical protein